MKKLTFHCLVFLCSLATSTLAAGSSEVAIKLKSQWQVTLNQLNNSVDEQGLHIDRIELGSDQSYFQIAKIWRSIVDLDFHEIDVLEDKILNFKFECQDIDCENASKAFGTFQNELVFDREKLRENYYQTRWKIARKRAAAYQDTIDKRSRLDIWNTSIYEDIIREVYSILDRALGFLYTKAKMFQSSLQIGVKGLFTVIRDIFYLFMVFIVPWLIYRAIGALLPRLDKFKESMYIKRPYGFTKSVRIANYLSFFAPFLPWIAAIFTLRLCTWLVSGTVFDELTAMVPVLVFYFYFRMAEICLEKIGNLLIIKSNQKSSASEYSKLITSTVSTLGWFFLTVIAFLYLTELAVGKAIIFDMTFHLTLLIGGVVCLFTLSKWNPILILFLEKRLDNAFYSYLARGCKSNFKMVFAIPTLLIIMSAMIVERVGTEISEWEFTKTISAQIFSKRLEDSIDNNTEKQSLSQEYIGHLVAESKDGINQYLMNGNEKVLQTATTEIKEWEDGQSEEQSLVLIGEKGSGKSTLLKRIGDQFQDKLKIISIKLDRRVESKQEVFALFDKYIPDLESEGLTSLYKFDSLGEKVLFLVDDAHYLFLTRLQGFEGYKTLVDMVNARTNNIFWCTTFNKEAWNFLNGVFGRRSYFRNCINLEKWSDNEIREMIQKRHQKTNTKVSFATLTRGRIETVQAETLFYRLLWEQSGGNPQVAIHLWLDSVYPIRGTALGIRPPSRPLERELTKLSDTCHFVFMAICRHEYLTRSQIANVLQISELEVANALKIGLESKILVRIEQGYTVSLFWQKSLINFLKARNFLYG